ncbi:MAG: hypothetical protein MZW92_10360 [Comamonadaceae bacterium]|nr:hypothetical protein [Comamonadaceae bacterium]
MLLAIDAPVDGALRPGRPPAGGTNRPPTSRPSGRRRTRSGRAEPTAQQLEACMAAADRLVVNDGTIPEFHRKLEEVA